MKFAVINSNTELVLILSLAGMWPWAWMMLLHLPLVMLLIEHYEHRLTADVNALLSESVEELGLVTVEPKPE